MNDTATSNGNAITSALEALLANQTTSEAFARLLFDLNYVETKARDLELADMLRACAIPRSFNAEIIGILRNQIDDIATNQRLLRDLVNFHFVLPVPSTSDYTYHDSTRQLLWGDWQSAEHLPQFEIYQNRLVSFYRLRGENAQKEKRFEEALASFNLAIELSAEDGTLYNLRGRTFVTMGTYQAAVTDLKKSIVLNAGNTNTYFDLSIAHYYLHEITDSQSSITRAIELEPTNASAYHNRGLIYYSIMDYEKALADYSKAIQLDPQYADFYINRGNVYCSQKEYEKAIVDYNKAIQLNPQSASANYNRGNVYAALEEYEKALADYDKALQLSPQDAEVYNSRGLTYSALEQYVKAIVDYDEAIRLNPQYGYAYINRGNAYVVSKNNEKALADYSEAIRRNPQDASSFYDAIKLLASRVPDETRVTIDSISDAPMVEVPSADTSDANSAGGPRVVRTLAVGQEVKGIIKRTSEFGAFIDIGVGRDGLVHISELSTRRVAKVTDVLTEGAEATFWIKELDRDRNRISLTMIEPGTKTVRDMQKGDIIKGKVSRIMAYGAFIDIGIGRDALLHAREMSERFVPKPEDVVTVGEEIEARIIEIERRRARVDLSIKGLRPEPEPEMPPPPNPKEVREATAAQARAEEAVVEDKFADLPAMSAIEAAFKRAMGHAAEDEKSAKLRKQISSATQKARSQQEEVIFRILRRG